LGRTAAVPKTDSLAGEPDPELPGLGEAVRLGLDRPDKSLPSRFFYDEQGSRLFEEICELPEYYLTRAETEILERHAQDLSVALPRIETLIELGSGSSIKTEILLRAFEHDRRPLRYAPIDVSRSALEESSERLADRHPGLEILPTLAEYEDGIGKLAGHALGPRLILWLGSSIGNLDRHAAADFLERRAAEMGGEDRLLVGIDLRKDRETLERAYDDARGVTARFDLNLLARINRELGGDFELACFRHEARYDEVSGAVESHLVSQRDQSVRIGALGLEIEFAAEERIHTENSYKYSLEEIDEVAREAGLAIESQLFDTAQRFTLSLLRLAG